MPTPSKPRPVKASSQRKSVLGNDPFRREPLAPPPTPPAKPAEAAPPSPPATPRPRPVTPVVERQPPPPVASTSAASPPQQPPEVVEPAQALAKSVLVPKIDTDPQPPGSEAPPRSARTSAAGPLAELGKTGKRFLMGAASSPTFLRAMAIGVSGAQALRSLVSLAAPPPEVDDFGQDASARLRYDPALDFLYDQYWRVDVQGARHLTTSGPLLAICNHAGALPLDGPVVRTALERSVPSRPARWLVEDAVFHAPFLGTWLNRLGAVRACPENADRLLESGQALAVFPEGIWGIRKSWRRRYQLQRFGRGGFVKLALRWGASLVPTAVIGSEEAMPILATIPAGPLGIPFIPITPTFPLLGLAGLVPLPAKWTVAFCAPLDLSRYGPDDARDAALVQRLTEDVRDRIHQETSRVLAERRNAFRS